MRLEEATTTYVYRNGRAGAYQFGKIWHGGALRYIPPIAVSLRGEWPHLLIGYWSTANNAQRAVYMLGRGSYGELSAITKEEFLTLGGILPEDVSPKDHRPQNKPEAELGQTALPTLWTGGEYLTPKKLKDRWGRIWQMTPSGATFRLVELEDGTQWQSSLTARKWQEGDTADLDLLYEEGLTRVSHWRGSDGALAIVSRELKLCFTTTGRGSKCLYVPITEEEWNPPGPYYTERMRMVMDPTLVAQVNVCVKCKRWLSILQYGCSNHHVCKECMPDHRHCLGCGRAIGNSSPATPSILIDGEARFCISCNMCFYCKIECLYCEPDTVTKQFNCRTCCKGEHYEDEITDSQAMEYIQDYTSHNYPPPRPPFPARKCGACAGTGIINISTTQVAACASCLGTGQSRAKELGNNPLWLGVELEVEVPKGLLDAAKTMSQWKKDIILKRDSTIRHGFEVVTGPFSLEEHTKLWPALSRELIRKGCRSWNFTNTGLHVHCNWEFLTQMQLCMYNVWLNDPNVKPQIVKIAGRESIFAALKPKVITDGEKPQLAPHREALNITTHRGKTFELRIFKGTLALEHILADLQFTHASVHWIKEAKVDQLSQWEPFWKYVQQHKELYPELIDHFDRQTQIEKSKEVA